MELGRKIAFQFGSQIYSKHERRKEENIKKDKKKYKSEKDKSHGFLHPETGKKSRRK